MSLPKDTAALFDRRAWRAHRGRAARQGRVDFLHVEIRTILSEAELAEEGGVSPRVSPAIELGDAAALLQRAGFALPVADSETITVGYPDMLALMRDLRGMGETNALAARRRGGWRRGTLVRAAALYAERFGDA